MAKRKRNPKNPSSLLFWNDLENDEKLGTCSLAAKGLWTCHLLPIAARSPEPGVIMIGSWPSKVHGDLPVVLSNKVGASPDVVGALLDELINSGAASVDDSGRLLNRRMVREAKTRAERANAGAAGGRATQEKRRAKQDVKHPPKQTSSKRVSKAASKGASKQSSKLDGHEEELNLDAVMENPASVENDGKQTPSKAASDPASKIQPSSCFMLHASEEDSVSSKEETALRAPGNLTSQLFGQCLHWLIANSGRSERDCRALIGTWRKTVGEAEAIAAIGRAQSHGVSDPVAWITKAIASRPNGKAPKNLVQDDIDFVERMRLQEVRHGE